MATKITTPELFNLSSNNTAATQLPVFTTSTRPTPTTSTVQVEYLVVAGGGGGGNFDGGGGGAGGYLTNYNGTPISITTSNLYTVAVGEGGVGGQKSVITSGVGGNSIFDTIISYGGGGGASDNNTGPSSDGGSGGGAAGGSNPTIGLASPAGQGYNGGNSSGNLGGGGGGASEAGNTDSQGHGGDGLSNSITGTATFYAGGGGGDYRSGGYPGGDGGGAAGSGSLPSNNGTPNTGGGGGAIGGATNYQGGSGGSGIVILRYPTSSSLNITTTGSLVYTESTDGSDTVLQFTEGSGNFGFAADNIAVGEMIFNSTTEKVEYWDGFQWNMIKDEDTYVPFSDAFFNELWYSVDSPYSCSSNRATVSTTVADFSTYTEGQIDFNTTAKTSGKWYIEIKQLVSTGHNGYSVFQKSGNTTYNTPPYVSSNPMDGNYGITLYGNGNACWLGNTVITSPAPNLAIGTNQVACIAVDVDNQKVWFGKKTSTTATSVTWVSGTNPATNTGGYSVGFTEFDPMVSHVSETSSRQSEFGYVASTDFTTPTGFENWKGDFASTLTVNCSTH